MAALASGCASSRAFIAENYAAPQRVAVLPMANETTDLDGPVFVRKLLHDQLVLRGYQVHPLQDVDAKLHEQGFTDGGQLGAATPEQLGQWTDADGLLYTTLVNFSYINLGYYWQRKVTVFGRLVSAKSGETLWEAERTWMTLNVVTKKEQAQREFAVQMAAKALEKMAHVPLQAESHIVVRRLLDTLPYRR